MGHAGHWSRLFTTGPREPGKGIPASDSISGKERADARVPPSDTYDGGWGGWLEYRVRGVGISRKHFFGEISVCFQ